MVDSSWILVGNQWKMMPSFWNTPMLPLSFPIFADWPLSSSHGKSWSFGNGMALLRSRQVANWLLVMSFFQVNSCQQEVSLRWYSHSLEAGLCSVGTSVNLWLFFARQQQSQCTALFDVVCERYDALCDYFVEKQRVGHMLAMRVRKWQEQQWVTALVGQDSCKLPAITST